MKLKLFMCLLMTVFFSMTLFAQEEEIKVPEIKEFKQPKPVKVANVDELITTSYLFYNKVIEERKRTDAEGYEGAKTSILNYKKEGAKLVLDVANLAKGGIQANAVKKKMAQAQLVKTGAVLKNATEQLIYMAKKAGIEDEE